MVIMQLIVFGLCVIAAAYTGYTLGQQAVWDDIEWRLDLMDQAMDEWEEDEE